MLATSYASVLFVPQVKAESEGWLSGWSYRKSHVIEAASGAGTNYQVKITAHYGSQLFSSSYFYSWI